ncbi:MAG: Ni/Fe hydrogenase subunit alpha [Hahellaceae bacterium]|nr:Ni/Fe hydrogenase subunit alpha [Hahellaceae bacterium]
MTDRAAPTDPDIPVNQSRSESRRIEIDPITRVEGHGKVSIHLNSAGEVDEARLHIVEFRGFERFIEGRLLWEVPVIVQRLCGICPVSHHLAAAKAMDQIVGVDQLTPTAEKMRRLMHYGQVLQSHVLHFFHLSSPDLLFGFDAPAEQRNIFAVIQAYPELARRAVLLRKFGQDIIEVTAGKKIHGTGAIPGGINRHLTLEERDRLLGQIDELTQWCRDALKVAENYCEQHLDMLKSFASFESNFLSLVREDGALDLYHGVLSAQDALGHPIFAEADLTRFNHYLHEEVKDWSYMKFPFIQSLGPESGWYRVGPLARINNCKGMTTSEADLALKRFRAVLGKHCGHSLAYHWARMIEVLHCIEVIARLLEDSDLLTGERVIKGVRREEGIGMIEAPRGTLIHHYKVDEHDQVQFCNLIVSTTHNNTAMNRAITMVAKQHLNGQPNLDDALLNHVEVAVRAYDPCLSCATHALGQMPLQIELLDAQGQRLQMLSR